MSNTFDNIIIACTIDSILTKRPLNYRSRTMTYFERDYAHDINYGRYIYYLVKILQNYRIDRAIFIDLISSILSPRERAQMRQSSKHEFIKMMLCKWEMPEFKFKFFTIFLQSIPKLPKELYSKVVDAATRGIQLAF